MQLQTGNYVIYRSSEICRIDGFETKCFDGATQREYCILVPENDQRSKYYVPMDRAKDKLRCLLSKEDIYSLIEGMKGEQPDWGDAETHRKDRFNEVLGCGDHRLIISMLHSLYLEKQDRLLHGKKLLAADEKAMKAAEALINREFSFVLGIKETEMESFILDRLSAK